MSEAEKGLEPVARARCEEEETLLMLWREYGASNEPMTEGAKRLKREIRRLVYEVIDNDGAPVNIDAHPPTSEWNDAIEAVRQAIQGADIGDRTWAQVDGIIRGLKR